MPVFEVMERLQLEIDLALEKSCGRITPWIANARLDLWFMQDCLAQDAACFDD